MLEYRRLNKRQKAAYWESFHEKQAQKTALKAATRCSNVVGTIGRAYGNHVRGEWSMNAMQTMLKPPPILATPPALVMPPAAPLVETPPLPHATPPASTLTWMQPEDWEYTETLREVGLQKTSGWSGKKTDDRRCVRNHLTAERATAAGLDADLYFDENGAKHGASASHRLSKAVRRAERAQDPDQGLRDREADARRKRVRRIELGKEDRDALRKLARERDHDLLLEPTPAGVRETATDGTPRSAKAAGAKLRQLTRTFYERLGHVSVTHEDFTAVRVETEYWDVSEFHRQGWEMGERPLKGLQ